MFEFLTQNKTEKRVTQIDVRLSRSFENVKRDTQNIFSWLKYLYQQNAQQQQIMMQQQQSIMSQQKTIQSLQKELSYIPKKPEDIKRIIDSYYSYDALLARMQELHQKVDVALQTKSQEIVQQKIVQKEQQVQPVPVQQSEQPMQASKDHEALQKLQQRIEDLEQKRKANIRDHVIKRISKNSKEYVKSLVLSYVRKYSQISALQLKEMIVHDQGLASKSSFYRILEEIESLSEIGVAKKGKQKYYLYRPTKKH